MLSAAIALAIAMPMQARGDERDLAALRDLEADAMRTPQDAPLLDRLAFLQFRLGEGAAALDSLARADSVDAKIAYTAYLRGVILETAFDFIAAEKAYEEALTRDPANVAAAVDLAALEKRIADATRFAALRRGLDRDLVLVLVLVFFCVAGGVVLVRRLDAE